MPSETKYYAKQRNNPSAADTSKPAEASPVVSLKPDAPAPAVATALKHRPPSEAVPPSSEVLDSAVKNERWVALLIGICQYADGADDSGFPSLTTPGNDVRELAEVLKNDYGFDEVKTLLDKDASLVGIRAAFDDLHTRCGKNDNVFVYYAGHGHVKSNGAGIWIPSDATSIYQGMDNAEIKEFLVRLPARRVLLVSDSCYSGEFLTRSAQANRSIRIATEESAIMSTRIVKNINPSREVLTSGNLAPVPDVGTGYCAQHSPFACDLILALQQVPSGGVISTTDLYVNIYQKRRDVDNMPQKGTLEGHRQGEFFLMRRK